MRRSLEQVKRLLNLMKITKETFWKGLYLCAEAKFLVKLSPPAYMPLGFTAKIVMDSTPFVTTMI